MTLNRPKMKTCLQTPQAKPSDDDEERVDLYGNVSTK